jgi:hypothetical protein
VFSFFYLKRKIIFISYRPLFSPSFAADDFYFQFLKYFKIVWPLNLTNRYKEPLVIMSDVHAKQKMHSFVKVVVM